MSKPTVFSKIQDFAAFVWKLIFTILYAIMDFFVKMIVFIFLKETKWEPDYEEREKNILFNNGRGSMQLVLKIASVLIKADNTRKTEELDYINKKIAHDFGEITASSWMMKLREYREQELNLNKLTFKAYQHFTLSTKIQMLHFLAGIATTDTLLTSAEFDVLKKICKGIRIPSKTLMSILAMYDYVSEAEANRKSKYQSKPVQSPLWGLKKSYAILEIDESATEKEIKKAYRKLVKKHHPDKVLHMGEKFQEQAEEKFRQIAEAYEAIKQKRGFA